MTTFRLSRRALSLATLALLLFATSALAQLQTGNLLGVVTDNAGAALPGVTVTVVGGPAPQVEITDAEGRFRFLGLAPGRYQVQAQLEEFTTRVDPEVLIAVDRNTSLELALKPAFEGARDGSDEYR
jgi:hypothetical protein